MIQKRSDEGERGGYGGSGKENSGVLKTRGGKKNPIAGRCSWAAGNRARGETRKNEGSDKKKKKEERKIE